MFTACRSCSSSSSVQEFLLIDGSRWLYLCRTGPQGVRGRPNSSNAGYVTHNRRAANTHSHAESHHRSLHCLPMRPGILCAISDHLVMPASMHSEMMSSSSRVHGPFTSPGRSTCQQTRRQPHTHAAHAPQHTLLHKPQRGRKDHTNEQNVGSMQGVRQGGPVGTSSQSGDGGGRTTGHLFPAPTFCHRCKHWTSDRLPFKYFRLMVRQFLAPTCSTHDGEG
jgi:hypothetical protein